MALASLSARSVLGMASPEVFVEVHATNGLPSFSMVGLPETSVKESKDRVRSAVLSSGFAMSPKRITVNLAPADLPKTGGRFDLAIALGVLIATQQLAPSNITNFELFGELALNGELRHTPGLLPSLLEALEAGKKVIFPVANQAEAQLILRCADPQKRLGEFYPVQDLRQACQVLLQQPEGLALAISAEAEATFSPTDMPARLRHDLADVHGQLQAKRVLEIAASGHHSIMMVGPPGAGKSMLAARLPGIMPVLLPAEALELASIRSVAGESIDADAFFDRPFVNPHHTASAAALVGGGSQPRPGALSLAHHGVLFLDELPEFNRNVLEALREPLESKQVSISRVHQHVEYPANNLLITAMNPSPSGFFPDDPQGRCQDTPDQILRYQKKISGPLLDRIDLHLEVPPVDIQALHAGAKSQQSLETSAAVRKRVSKVRDIQIARQGCYNSQLSTAQLPNYVQLDHASETLLERAVNELGLSARGYHRVLRLARTIADMQGEQHIVPGHLAEALSYRSQQRALS